MAGGPRTDDPWRQRSTVPLSGDLFSAAEMRRLFGDDSMIRDWLHAKAAPAGAEADLRIIQAARAEEIRRKAWVERLDTADMKRWLQPTHHQVCAPPAGADISRAPPLNVAPSPHQAYARQNASL